MTKRCSRGLGHPKPGQMRGHLPPSSRSDPVAAGRSGVVASSFEQGLISFRHILHFLAPSFERHGRGGRGRFRVQDSANRAVVQDRETGAMGFGCLGAIPGACTGPRHGCSCWMRSPSGRAARWTPCSRRSRRRAARFRGVRRSGSGPGPRRRITRSRKR